VAHNISPAKHYSLLLSFYSPFLLLLEESCGDNFSSFGSTDSVSEFGKPFASPSISTYYK